jgi:hypothetical protein
MEGQWEVGVEGLKKYKGKYTLNAMKSFHFFSAS